MKDKAWLKSLLVGLAAIVMGLVAGALVIILSGASPIDAYRYLIEGGFQNLNRFGNVLETSSTLILAGLAATFAFKTGLFNIGISGQMLMGAICSYYVVLTFDLPAPIAQITAIIVSMIVGALWAAVPGLLKAIANVSEVVGTIMMNWIAYWLIFYSISIPTLKGAFDTQTAVIPLEKTLRVSWLTNAFNGSVINLSIFIAIAAIFVVWFILEKTTFGYSLKAVGLNRHASRYAGIKVERGFVYSMMISGALAGLAGVSYYFGRTNIIQIGLLPKEGMDGIAVALVGASSPFGVGLSALFFGLITTGNGYMQAMTGIPREIADLLIGIIIYFAATSILMRDFFEKLIKRIGKKSNLSDIPLEKDKEETVDGGGK